MITVACRLSTELGLGRVESLPVNDMSGPAAVFCAGSIILLASGGTIQIDIKTPQHLRMRLYGWCDYKASARASKVWLLER